MRIQKRSKNILLKLHPPQKGVIHVYLPCHVQSVGDE